MIGFIGISTLGGILIFDRADSTTQANFFYYLWSVFNAYLVYSTIKISRLEDKLAEAKAKIVCQRNAE